MFPSRSRKANGPPRLPSRAPPRGPSGNDGGNPPRHRRRGPCSFLPWVEGRPFCSWPPEWATTCLGELTRRRPRRRRSPQRPPRCPRAAHPRSCRLSSPRQHFPPVTSPPSTTMKPKVPGVTLPPKSPTTTLPPPSLPTTTLPLPLPPPPRPCPPPTTTLPPPTTTLPPPPALPARAGRPPGPARVRRGLLTPRPQGGGADLSRCARQEL